MSWTEVEEAAKGRAAMMVPIGVIEQHDPHLPLGSDTYGALIMSHLVKDELEKLRAPTARADSGGIRSHPPFIAREYLVPAVAAMGKETGFLRVGQVVTVDGPLGRIEIAPEE